MASLSAGLLARKGEARPSTRRQSTDVQRSGVELETQPAPTAQPPGKCSFTLRLDQARHLNLHMAAAASGRSAQQLIIEALDAFFVTLPEGEALTTPLPASSKPDRSGT